MLARSFALLPSRPPLSLCKCHSPRRPLAAAAAVRAPLSASFTVRPMSSQRSDVSGRESWDKLRGHIASTRFCMLATTQADGVVRSRPMAAQSTDHDQQGELWFFTRRHSHKVDELKQQPNVNVSFIAQGETLFISVSGRAELVLDKQRMKDLWTPALKVLTPHPPTRATTAPPLLARSVSRESVWCVLCAVWRVGCVRVCVRGVAWLTCVCPLAVATDPLTN